jgi:hypothetical protein
MGVAEYQLVRALPESLLTSLPTVEALENELATWPDELPTADSYHSPRPTP